MTDPNAASAEARTLAERARAEVQNIIDQTEEVIRRGEDDDGSWQRSLEAWRYTAAALAGAAPPQPVAWMAHRGKEFGFAHTDRELVRRWVGGGNWHITPLVPLAAAERPQPEPHGVEYFRVEVSENDLAPGSQPEGAAPLDATAEVLSVWATKFASLARDSDKSIEFNRGWANAMQLAADYLFTSVDAAALTPARAPVPPMKRGEYRPRKLDIDEAVPTSDNDRIVALHAVMAALENPELARAILQENFGDWLTRPLGEVL